MTVTVGVLYPGYSGQDDYPRMQRLLGSNVRLPLVHTEMRVDAHHVDGLLDVGGDDVLAEGARALAPQRPDAVLWACTSGSFVFGWAGAQAQLDALTAVAGVPASSTSFAFADAAHRLGLTRVAVAATYPPGVTELFAAFLSRAGIEVVQLASRGILTAAEVGTLGRAEVLAFAAASDHPSAEALLMPDTALHTVAWLEELEQRLGKPVLTANQVSVWQGLRLAGVDTPRPGAGALFRRPAPARKPRVGPSAVA